MSKRPPEGAHIKVRRWLPFPYTHHGVYIGNDKVIHLTGGPMMKLLGLKKPVVRQDSLDDFCDGANWKLIKQGSYKAINKAQKSLGYEDYNLITNNCEHFATWCTTNDAHSLQALGLRRTGSLLASTTG